MNHLNNQSQATQKPRVIVTGGAGYIGSIASQRLLDNGYQVFVLDNLSTGFRDFVPPQAQFYEVDIQNQTEIEKLIFNIKPQAVMHFAALTEVARSIREPDRFYANNVIGSLHLIQAIKKYQQTLTQTNGNTPPFLPSKDPSVVRFIFSSTAAVYANPGKHKVTEDSLIDPLTPYGKSKKMVEDILTDFHKASLNESGVDKNYLPTIILRYFNVAGASLDNRMGQVGDFHTALVKRAAMAAVGKISEMSVFGTDYPTKDGTAIRDFIHVEDLVDIHVRALNYLMQDSNIEKKSNFPMIFNCGYSQGYTVNEVLQTMQNVSGKNFQINRADRRPGDLCEVVADTQRLQRFFDWQPKHNQLQKICLSAFEWEKKSQVTNSHPTAFVRTNDFQQAPVQGQYISMAKKDIIFLGLKKSGLSLAFAIFSIPFPGLHLIAVPLGLTLCIYFLFKTFKDSSQSMTIIPHAVFKCPKCQTENNFKKWILKTKARFSCQNCGEQLVLEY